MSSKFSQGKKITLQLMVLCILLAFTFGAKYLAAYVRMDRAPRNVSSCTMDFFEKDVLYQVDNIVFFRGIEQDASEDGLQYAFVGISDADGDWILGLLQFAKGTTTYNTVSELIARQESTSERPELLSFQGYVSFTDFPANPDLMENYALAIDSMGIDVQNDFKILPYMIQFDYDAEIDSNTISRLVLEKSRKSITKEKWSFYLSFLLFFVLFFAWKYYQKKDDEFHKGMTSNQEKDLLSSGTDLQNANTPSLYMKVNLALEDYKKFHEFTSHRYTFTLRNIFIFLLVFSIYFYDIWNYEQNGTYSQGLKSLLMFAVYVIFVILFAVIFTKMNNKRQQRAVQKSVLNEYSISVYDTTVVIQNHSGKVSYDKNSLTLHEDKEHYYIYYLDVNVAILPKRFIPVSKTQFEQQFYHCEYGFQTMIKKMILYRRIMLAVFVASAIASLGIIGYSFMNTKQTPPESLWDYADEELSNEQLYYIDNLYPFSYYYYTNVNYYVAAFYDDQDVLRFAEVKLNPKEQICKEIDKFFEDDNAQFGDCSFGGYVKLQTNYNDSNITRYYLDNLVFFKDSIHTGECKAYPYALEYVYTDDYSVDDVMRNEAKPLRFKRAFYAFLADLLLIFAAIEIVLICKSKKAYKEYESLSVQLKDEVFQYQPLSTPSNEMTKQQGFDFGEVDVISMEQNIFEQELARVNANLSAKEVKAARKFHFTKRNLALKFLYTYLPCIVGYGIACLVALKQGTALSSSMVIGAFAAGTFISLIYLLILRMSLVFKNGYYEQASQTKYMIIFYESMIVVNADSTKAQYQNLHVSKFKKDRKNYYLYVTEESYLIIPKSGCDMERKQFEAILKKY